MNNNSTLNVEEAVNIVSEFIYSIDNLPNEVQFLLSEIRVKDTRAQEIQQEIDRESAKYVRHTLRSNSSSSSTSTSLNSSSISSSSSPSNSTTPGQPTTNQSSSASSAVITSSPTISCPDSPKPNTTSAAAPSSPSSPSSSSSSVPAKIAASYAEIQLLCDEKCALAQRLIELINRTRARLEYDLAKVRVLQGEPVEYMGIVGAAAGIGKLNGIHPTVTAAVVSSAAAAGTAGLAGIDGGAMRRSPAIQLSESLRSALRASPSVNTTESTSVGGGGGGSGGGGGGGSATKRRRLGTTTSIKLTTPSRRRSASPVTTVTATTHTHQRSRLSRQVVPPEESEEEGEGEENAEEMEDVDADDDDKIYCFCRKKSFGDMIACDNEGNCPYEWFHLSCVGLKQPPPETWYCSVCSANMTKGGSGSTRKGRKK